MGCSCGPGYDVCSVLRAPRFRPQVSGKGKVYARYGNKEINFNDIWITSADRVTGKPDWDRIVVNACGHSNKMRWSLVTSWFFFENEEFPLDLEDINIRDIRADTGVIGHLLLCDESDCTASDVQIAFDSWGSPGGGFNREGKVISYNPVEGNFEGWFAFDNYEHKSIEVRVDVNWDPPSEADTVISSSADDAGDE
jgi:hypothetical protein